MIPPEPGVEPVCLLGRTETRRWGVSANPAARMRMWMRLGIGAAMCLTVALAGDASRAQGARVDFERQVAPILIRRCVECHSGTDPSGHLDLTRRQTAVAGGESGKSIVPGDAAGSALLKRVRDGEMPPKRQGVPQRLPSEEAEILESWIAAGADWPADRRLDPFEFTTERRGGRDGWSLQPVARPAIPDVKRTGWVRTPPDAFVLAELERTGWEPAPEADRRTLIRRVFYDLTGLPPSFGQVRDFEADDSPQAYERVVDRLLASPQYGERWARHWLDVVRYAETCGYERDQVKPQVWKYRDWVIRAFNEDKPYDRFVMEQLAGDELPDADEATWVATGFLRLGTWNDEPNDPEEYKYERLEDLVHATSTAFLGMTVKCARCHDHKFDPITQLDYHRMAAGFWAGYIQPGQGVLGGPDPKKLAFDVLAWTDVSSDPPPLRFLKKGDPHRPGDPVEPGPLSMIPALLFRSVPPPPPGAETTRRRRHLAEWIVDPANPLTARVWVNRIWQHHFGRGLVGSPDNFGFTGDRPTHPELLDWLAGELVRNGWRTKPLHKLIVMSSTYRQASIHPRQDEYANEDAANRRLWRAERRRLDAEALRDSLLWVAGNLDLTRMGGPSFAPVIGADALEGLSMKAEAWKASPPEEQGRRTIYAFTKRSLLPPLATVFDFPDTTLPCGQRDVSVVAPQALALMNNAFVHEQSAALTRRVAAVARDEGERIEWAWRLALGRSPTSGEAEQARRHLARETAREEALGRGASVQDTHHRPPAMHALASLCHVLLNTNEFIYVD
ncbi:MAG: PSD1 and planctomycete cytochrome C domain-containing protein [Limisphaerales bacterium]